MPSCWWGWSPTCFPPPQNIPTTENIFKISRGEAPSGLLGCRGNVLQTNSYYKERPAQCLLTCSWNCLTSAWREWTPQPSVSKAHKNHPAGPVLLRPSCPEPSQPQAVLIPNRLWDVARLYLVSSLYLLAHYDH